MNFNDQDRVILMPSLQQYSSLHLQSTLYVWGLSSCCDNPKCWLFVLLSGGNRNKAFHWTRYPVTVSSIQLMDYDHGHHYLLKIQAQQCPSTQIQPCWHTDTVKRSWRFDPKSTLKNEATNVNWQTVFSV